MLFFLLAKTKSAAAFALLYLLAQLLFKEALYAI
jgi:hypothetical protein